MITLHFRKAYTTQYTKNIASKIPHYTTNIAAYTFPLTHILGKIVRPSQNARRVTG